VYKNDGSGSGWGRGAAIHRRLEIECGEIGGVFYLSLDEYDVFMGCIRCEIF
jgi:hypothetical protein